MLFEGMDISNKDSESYDKISDNNDTNDNNNKRNIGEKAIATTSKTKNNLGDSKGYFMSVRPPKINYSTIIIKPSSKGAAADRKKETLSDKAKDVEESIKRGLHID
ncbi:MAG: hypothetical protein K0R16_2287 [Nitrososphaeraceae archaeon]|nr:hypothetical protein [Nitrososphaeraceae archaeon]